METAEPAVKSHGAILLDALSVLSGTAAGSIKRLLDAIFLGMAGRDELVAYGFAVPLVLVVTSLGQAVYVATTTEFASERYSPGSTLSRSSVLQALALSLAAGITIAVALKWAAVPAVVLLGGERFSTKVDAFLDIWVFAIPCILVSGTSFSLMRLMGRIKTTGMISLFSTIIAAAASPVLILGINGSGLGLRGAAFSTLIGTGLPTLVTVAFVLRHTAPAPSHPADGAWKLARALASLLLPVFVSNLAVVLFLAAATRVVAGLGPAAVAAFTMSSRLEQFLLLLHVSLVTATIPQLARFLNRASPGPARVLARRVGGMMLVFGLGSATVLFLASGPIARALVPTPEVQVILHFFLMIMPLSYAFQGLFILSAGLLNVSRRPMISFLLSAARLFGVTFPVLVLASAAHGMKGFFLGFAACNVVTGIAAVFFVRRKLTAHDTVAPSSLTARPDTGSSG